MEHHSPWLIPLFYSLTKLVARILNRQGLAQRGEDPPHSKILRGIGNGVFEIRDDFDSNTYRLVYAVQVGKRLYVLHAFQKKSKKGIATPPKDVELTTRRYKEAVAMEKELQS